MTMEKIELFRKDIVFLVGGSMCDGVFGGLICINALKNYSSLLPSLLHSIGSLVMRSALKYNIKIVGINYNDEKPILFYKVRDLETNEVHVIQII